MNINHLSSHSLRYSITDFSLSGLPAAIEYPMYNSNQKDPQNFPFRTFSMLITILSLFVCSIVVHVLFQLQIIPRRFDFMRVFGDKKIKPFQFNDMLVLDGVNYRDDNIAAEEKMSERDNDNVGYSDNGKCNSEKMELMTENGNGSTHEKPIKM